MDTITSLLRLYCQLKARAGVSGPSLCQRFTSIKQQYELSYYLAPSANYHLTTTLYRHDFERVWTKLNSFDTGNANLNEILTDPDSSLNEIFLPVLRGERDLLSDPETLLTGTNDREYYSQGVQTVGHWWPILGDVEHEVEIGVHYHEDEIERFQTKYGFLVRDGGLMRTAARPGLTTTIPVQPKLWHYTFMMSPPWARSP